MNLPVKHKPTPVSVFNVSGWKEKTKPMSFAEAMAKVRSWFGRAANPIGGFTVGGLFIGILIALFVPPMGLAVWGTGYAISWIVSWIVVPFVTLLLGSWVGLVITLRKKR